jgi:hypothetical protein
MNNVPPAEKFTPGQLAILYRTCWRNCYEGPRALLDDLEGNPDGYSLAGMIANRKLRRVDWGLVKFMMRADDDPEAAVAIAQFLNCCDSLRCEALLHAWPQDLRDLLYDAGWAEPYVENWDAVAAEMRNLEPLTWDHEKQDEVARPFEKLIAQGYSLYREGVA